MKRTFKVTGIALMMIAVATVLYIAFYSVLSALGVSYQGVSITEWTMHYIQMYPALYLRRS